MAQFPKFNLESRLQDLLAANFPEWIWNLTRGDKIGIKEYQGSWTPPGTQEYFPATFICISGNQLFYRRDDLGLIGRTPFYGEIKTVEELTQHLEKIQKYRTENPNWAEIGM